MVSNSDIQQNKINKYDDVYYWHTKSHKFSFSICESNRICFSNIHEISNNHCDIITESLRNRFSITFRIRNSFSFRDCFSFCQQISKCYCNTHKKIKFSNRNCIINNICIANTF
jgi:hypothetical protein